MRALRVCVRGGVGGSRGRIQGKIITANWPEAEFSHSFPKSQDTQDTCSAVLLTPERVRVGSKRERPQESKRQSSQS